MISDFKKAMQPGTKWIRRNYRNPKAKEPVEVSVVKATKEGLVLYTGDHSSFLTWPDRLGFSVRAIADGGWGIDDKQGLALSYMPVGQPAKTVVDSMLDAI